MAIEATIVTKVDNSQSIKAQQDLRKEIKSLRTELNGLNASTEKYTVLLKQITSLTETYQQKVLATKQAGTQFNDVVKTNVNVLIGVKKGFDDAAKSINLYANAQGNVKTLDKVTDISSGVNTKINIKGDYDKSITDGLDKQAVSTQNATKALTTLSNTQAGYGTSIQTTNNAISQQANIVNTDSSILNQNTNEVNQNSSAEEELNQQLIISTGSFREHLNEIKNDSLALSKLIENKKELLQWDNTVLENNKNQIKTLNDRISGNKLLIKTLIDLKGNSDINDTSIEKSIEKIGKGIPSRIAFLKNEMSGMVDTSLGVTIEEINTEIGKLDRYSTKASEGIAKLARENSILQKNINATTTELKRATSEQDKNNERIKNNTPNTTQPIEKDTKAKVDNAKATSVAAQRQTMLAFSMAQIIREAPVATMRMDMFFLAISNNIPMFSDQIKLMRNYNKEIEVSALELDKLGQVEEAATTRGKKLSIGKELFKSLASGNTIMMIAVTLLTAFGAEALKWAKSVWIGTKALEAQEKAMKDNVETYDMINKRAKEAASSLATLNLMYSQWTNIKSANLATRQKWFNDHKETLSKVGKGYKDLKSLEADWAVNGIKKYQQGIMKRAEATAAFTKLVELYERRLKLTDPARLKELTAWQRQINQLGEEARVLDKKIKDIQSGKTKGGETANLLDYQNRYTKIMGELSKLQKDIKAGDIASIASNAVVLSEIDKQINSYSKVADIKDEDIKNTKESGKTAAEFATDLAKQYTSLGGTIVDFYTEQKAGLDTWLKDQEDKYLKGSISESEFIKRKGQYNDKLNELDKLQVEYEYQNLIKSIADKKEAIRLEYEAKLAENKKDHKNNAEITKKANDIKTKSEANLTIELENALKTRNAKISDLEIKGKENSIINNKEYVDATINDFDRLYQELIFKQELFNNQISEQTLRKQSGKSFFGDLFSTDELQNELDNFDNIINQSTSILNAKSSKKSFLETVLESLTENTPEYLAKQKEINSLELEMSGERVKIAQAEADKKKAINDDWMANVEAYASTTTSSFQAIIDNIDASYEKQTNDAKENYDKDINNYNQQLEDKKITQEQYDKYVKAREKEFSDRNLDLQQKQNKKNQKWQAGIAIVDGLVGAGKALTGAMELGPIAGPIVGGIQSAAIMASTYATVKKIFAQKVSDSGSGGSVSSATTSAISSPLNYSASVLTSTQEQEINKPQKVYVLSSEIEAASKSNKVIVAESTF